jgi:hypothetical protein
MPRSPLPDVDLHRVRAFCAARVPEHARNQVRLEADVEGCRVTIVESRAPWRPEYGPAWTRSAVASLRYSPTHHHWTLFWIDHNGRWHRYQRTPPTATIDSLLHELKRDPEHIFWG